MPLNPWALLVSVVIGCLVTGTAKSDQDPGGLSGADLAAAVGNSISSRQNMLCMLADRVRPGLNAAEVATALGALTGIYRHNAIRCLATKVQTGLTGNDLAQIVGNGTQSRQNMLCTLSGKTREGMSATEVVTALGALTGIYRHNAIRCLAPRIQTDLIGLGIAQIVGDENRSRSGMICALRNNAQSELSGNDISIALGNITGVYRSSALRCLTSRSTSAAGGGAVDAATEARNADIFREYLSSIPDGQFLTAGDGPAWLQGQCVAWATQLYGRVSGRSLAGLSFGTARNMPSMLQSRGFTVVYDQTQPRVGALVVWDNGGAGHVGVVVAVTRNSQSGVVTRITVSEANFGRITTAGAERWQLTIGEATEHFVTEKYGIHEERTFRTYALNRDRYRFLAYVYP